MISCHLFKSDATCTRLLVIGCEVRCHISITLCQLNTAVEKQLCINIDCIRNTCNFDFTIEWDKKCSSSSLVFSHLSLRFKLWIQLQVLIFRAADLIEKKKGGVSCWNFRLLCWSLARLTASLCCTKTCLRLELMSLRSQSTGEIRED